MLSPDLALLGNYRQAIGLSILGTEGSAAESRPRIQDRQVSLHLLAAQVRRLTKTTKD